MAQIPDDIFNCILEYIPLPERWGRCALVSTQFRRAAAALTTEVSFKATHSWCDRATSFSIWLDQHGHGLTELVASDVRFGSLPCSRLCKLDLSHCDINFSSAQQGLLQALPALTSLNLQSCHLHGGPSDAEERWVVLLSAAHTQLLKLAIQTVQDSHRNRFPTMVLTCFKHLTSLRLRCTECTQPHDRDLQPVFSTLTLLQELSLAMPGDVYVHRHVGFSLEGLKHLQQLRSLELNTPQARFNIHASPSLAQLTALKELRLLACQAFDASVLLCWPQLQLLHVGSAGVTMISAAAALLEALQQLLELQDLKLYFVEFLTGEDRDALPQALFASSHLQHLHLALDEVSPNFWCNLFAAKAPQLRTLALNINRHSFYYLHASPSSLLGPFDLQLIASCCPGVQELRLLRYRASAGMSLAALQQLPCLTSLEISDISNAAASELACATQLERLCVNFAAMIDFGGLMCLTALTKLSDVRLHPVARQ